MNRERSSIMRPNRTVQSSDFPLGELGVRFRSCDDIHLLFQRLLSCAHARFYLRLAISIPSTPPSRKALGISGWSPVLPRRKPTAATDAVTASGCCLTMYSG